MILTEDEIINAVCVHTASRKQIRPSDVQVELAWDENTGFTAEVWAGGRNQYLVEANLIEAILLYMHEEYGRRVFKDEVRLELEDEIIAVINE
ncbi:YxcD family protein [Paenibacillus pinistramenti]|uniref:YxcD family protein n=1 Tax=Paenibacillus pinistramenti TaxID=1768003 RepID=UPI0011092D0C|nr:YxcD family protein [Paenibacillus pinistramenti]